MITHEMSNKALEIYWRLYTGKEKPPRRGTKLWNQQARVLGDILEGVRPDIEEAHLERLIAQAKGKILPFRNPVAGTWTKRVDKTGKFVEVKTDARPFKGARGER